MKEEEKKLQISPQEGSPNARLLECNVITCRAFTALYVLFLQHL